MDAPSASGSWNCPPGDQAQHVRAVVDDVDALLLAPGHDLLHGLGKEEEALAHDEDPGIERLHELQGPVHVDVPAVRCEGEVHDVLRVLANGAGLVVADVPAGRRGVHHDDVPRADVAAEDGVVGDGPADGPHVGVLAVEQRLHVLLQQALDLVDDLRSLVVALSGMALRVAVGEIGAHDPAHAPAGDVLTGDEIDAVVRARRSGP